MKTKAFLLLCVFSLVCAVPGYAQGKHYRGNTHTDKQGTDKQGPKDKGDRDDDGDDDGASDVAALQTRMRDVVASLSLGTLVTSNGAQVPVGAQGNVYVVLTNSIVSANNPPANRTMVSSDTQSPVDASGGNAPTVSRFVLALSTSGTSAQSKLATLTRNLLGLANDPYRVGVALRSFNDFVQAASPEFLANPPAEFVATHAVLQKLTAGLPPK